MRKSLMFIAVLGVVLTLSACSFPGLNNDSDIDTLSSKESLSTLAYLSGSLLDLEANDPVVSSNLVRLSATNETEVEDKLDEVNEYMDRLKEFMDNGTESFGNAVEEASDNPDYTFMITFTVNEEMYYIYYNIDEVTLEISGIMIIGDVEYVIEVSNTLSDSDALDDDDDDDEPEENNEDEDNEEKMVLTAYNGDDYVKVIYKVETDEEETETKFTLISNIAGVEKEVFMKISVEDDEFKITIKDGEDEYTFKREIEDGETTYKLKYSVNGVEGEVRIIETVNNLGETVYEYRIKEGDKSSTIEKDEPGHHSDDDDEEDENEEENEDENEEENEEA